MIDENKISSISEEEFHTWTKDHQWLCSFIIRLADSTIEHWIAPNGCYSIATIHPSKVVSVQPWQR